MCKKNSVKFHVHEITFYMVYSCLLSLECGPSEAPDNNGSGCSDVLWRLIGYCTQRACYFSARLSRTRARAI